MNCNEKKSSLTLYWGACVPIVIVSEGTDRRNTLKARQHTSHRRRIGSTHLDPRNMPPVIILKQRLADGTRVAVARSNDVFVACRFDASGEEMLMTPVRFDGGDAHDEVLAWVRKTANFVKNNR
jgi:hypothetical protein